jgi:hypothetical protein
MVVAMACPAMVGRFVQRIYAEGAAELKAAIGLLCNLLSETQGGVESLGRVDCHRRKIRLVAGHERDHGLASDDRADGKRRWNGLGRFEADGSQRNMQTGNRQKVVGPRAGGDDGRAGVDAAAVIEGHSGTALARQVRARAATPVSRRTAQPIRSTSTARWATKRLVS